MPYISLSAAWREGVTLMSYQFLYRSLFSHFDPESIHDFSVQVLRLAGNLGVTRVMLKALYAPKVISPPISAFGLQFAHPLGIAGGFDKNARSLPALQAIGFSFIEVGTVMPRPQPGNPRPRLYRLPHDKALINRMGFPSEGMDVVARRMSRLRFVSCPIGISLGKNKTTSIANADDDYLTVLNRLYPYGDFFVVNVSSPN